MKLNSYGENHIPLKFTWEVTEKCNLNCKMCYSQDKNSQNKSELDTLQARKLLNILEKNNVLYLFLEGGEPLLRRDFFTILPEITSKFCTWLSTNGTLITPDTAVQLKKNNIGTVFVSLHGSKSSVHDNITQTKGAFTNTIKGIEYLVDNKVPTMLSCQISKLNINDIEEYIKLCKFLKVKKINFLRPYPIGLGVENYYKYSFDEYEYEVFSHRAEELCRKHNILIGHSFSSANHNCCKQAYACDCSGKLMSCPYLRFLPRLGDILKDNILDVWNSKSSLEIRDTYKNIPHECKSCGHLLSCEGGCTAGRLLHAEGPEHKDMICGKDIVLYERFNYIKYSYPRVSMDMGISLFLYNPLVGKEFVLNKLGTLVWEILENPSSIDDICNQLKIEDQADKQIIENDIKKMCLLLEDIKLIKSYKAPNI